MQRASRTGARRLWRVLRVFVTVGMRILRAFNRFETTVHGGMALVQAVIEAASKGYVLRAPVLVMHAHVRAHAFVHSLQTRVGLGLLCVLLNPDARATCSRCLTVVTRYELRTDKVCETRGYGAHALLQACSPRRLETLPALSRAPQRA